MNTELCFGQRIDPELGILEPWYTHGALDRIKQMGLSDKYVLEYGAGDSTIWWLNKAQAVRSIDHNYEWFNKVREKCIEAGFANGKGDIAMVHTFEGDSTNAKDTYIHAWDYFGKPSIVVVDGIHRYECAEHAVKTLKPDILIIDNHQQDYVFICPALDELLKGVKMERFIQPNHTEHEGRPWATAIFYLNEKE